MKPRPPWWQGDARHHALTQRFETSALSHSASFADDQEGGLVWHRFHERLHHDINHGGLVDYQQVTVERIVVAALETAALGVDLEQPVNSLGLEAGRLGHTFCSAAGRSAQWKVGALSRKDTQNGIDDGCFANAGATGHDQHLARQGESDRSDLAFGKGKTDTLLDPRQGLVRIDLGPRQRAICKPHQPRGDGALRPMQAGQKDTRRFANPVGDHRALLQLEIERSADELLRNLKQLLGKRYQLLRRQAAMPLIHGLGQCIGNPRAHTDIAVFSMPSFMAMASAVLKPMPRMSRARRYGFSVMTWMASEP